MARRLDSARYEHLVRTAAPSAWRAARRVTRDDSAASDAVQDVFLGLAEGRLQLGDDDDAPLRLRTLAVRAALTRRRSEARRHTREDQAAMQQIERHPNEPALEPERREERACVRRALADLPDELRLPLVLRYEEDLSFAAIADSLGMSESGAHERVQRGLNRLRAALAGVAAAALATPSLEAALRDAPVPTPPAGLVSKLVGLRAGALGAGAWIAACGVALVATGLVSAAALGGGGGFAESAAVEGDLPVAALAPDANPEAQPASPRAQEPAPRTPAGRPNQDPRLAPAALPPVTGVVVGRVVDPTGVPVPGATLRVTTVEREGKFAVWSGTATTDANGRFEATVPLHAGGGVNFDLSAGRLGYVSRAAQRVRVTEGARADAGDVILTAPEEDREGEFTLHLEVRGPNGAPVPGAEVRVAHTVPNDSMSAGPGVTFQEWTSDRNWLQFLDGQARTGQDGRLTVTGERLGSKRVAVRPGPDHAPLDYSFALLEEGEHHLQLALDVGREIRGRLEWVDGGPVTGPMQVNAILGPAEWHSGTVATDGTFRVEGLGPNPVRLRFNPGWKWDASQGAKPSLVELTATPGETDAVIRLKRSDDSRDVGLHNAELHGRCVDAVTGKVLPIGPYSVNAWPVNVPEGFDLERDLLPNLIHAPPVQRSLSGKPVSTPAFHKVGLGAASYILLSEFRGRGTAYAGPFTLGEREVVAGIELRPALPADLAVTVSDAHGRPLEGAYVFLTGVGPHSDGVIREADAQFAEADGRGVFFVNSGRRTDALGRVILTGLPDGITAVICAVHPKHAPGTSARLTTRAGETLPATVQMPASR